MNAIQILQHDKDGGWETTFLFRVSDLTLMHKLDVHKVLH